jgi:hypothetical protein
MSESLMSRRISVARVATLVVYGGLLFTAGMAYEHYATATLPTIRERHAGSENRGHERAAHRGGAVSWMGRRVTRRTLSSLRHPHLIQFTFVLRLTGIAVAVVLTGCATTGTDGVVQIGPDLYMVGGLGNFTDFSSSGVKARFYQEATRYCNDKGRVMIPVNSTGKDSGYGTYASAEVQFRCVEP